MNITLYLLALLFLPLYGFSKETIQKKKQNILNNKAIDTPFEKLKTGIITLENYLDDLSFEEAILLCNDALMSLVEKHVKDKRKYNIAYKFLVMNYEPMNRTNEMLKRHKLLLNNTIRKSDNHKIIAMDDMPVKHKTKKKKEQIDRLIERNKTTRKILILTISLIAVLLMVLLLFIRFYKLRKKDYTRSIYETMLLADLKQTKLEQNLKEKEQLQQQYDDLKSQTDQNKQKTLLSDNELKHLKQQLEQKPIKTMIEKLMDWISESYIEKTKKNVYIQRLSELDVNMIERGYLTSNEKISNMDIKYIICFAINMEVKDMSLLFNVEPASIRSVRYRIKKKFGEKNTFKFLM